MKMLWIWREHSGSASGLLITAHGIASITKLPLCWLIWWRYKLKSRALVAEWLRLWGICVGSAGKESICSAGDLGSIPGLERSPGERNGNPLQYPSLQKSEGAWWATIHGVAKSQTWQSTIDLIFKSQNLDNCIVVRYQVSNFTLNANVHSMSGTHF